MRDTIITAKQKKTEIKSWLVCFLIANLANIYAIIKYDNSSFLEIFTSLGYVVVASVALYVLWIAIRIIFYGVKKIVRSKK